MVGSIVRVAALLSAGALLFGCPKKTEGVSDAAPQASESATASSSAAPAAPEAANVADIRTHPDQTALDHIPAEIIEPVATAHVDDSAASAVVATLKRGTNVTKIASKGAFYLVLFTDPKTPGRTLEGWIDGSKAFVNLILLDAGHPPDAAAPAIDAGAAPAPTTGHASYKTLSPAITCNAGYARAGQYCRYICSSNNDCVSGAACKRMPGVMQSVCSDGM